MCRLIEKTNLVGSIVTSCSFTCFFCLVCDSNVVSIRERPSGNAFFDKMMKKKKQHPQKNTHIGNNPLRQRICFYLNRVERERITRHGVREQVS